MFITRIRLVIPFVVAFVLFACTDKATKFYNSGLERYENEEYDLAAHDLQQAVTYGAPKKNSYYTIAESYRKSNRLHLAEEYYRKAIEAGCDEDNALFYLGLAMKANGNYLGAQSQFKKFLKEGYDETLLLRAKEEINAIDQIMAVGFRKDFYKVRNFKALNTEAIEYSPILYNDRTLYFTSSRGEGPIYPGQGTRYKDIFSYTFDGGANRSGVVRKLPELINEPRRHESSATFSSDGRTMIFSRSGNGKRNDYIEQIDLFESKLEGGQWSTPTRLDISVDEAWDSSPFLTKDGKTLYFSSNREGGYGSDDIWKSTKNADGTWGEPVNLGDTINTEFAEMFPYEKENGEFYFSSDGHVGYGNLDIFKVIKGDNNQSIVINPGQPLNSSFDDFAIIFDSEKTGYFSSNRPGGQGDDDIYIFDYDVTITYALEGQTRGKVVVDDEITDQTEILPFTRVELRAKNGNYITSVVSDSVGFFKFNIDPEKEYLLMASQSSYHDAQEPFSSIGLTRSTKDVELLGSKVVANDTVVLEPFVKNTVIEFPPIYYDYDDWKIVDKSKEVLDKMVKTLEEHPNILVELGSHTDARGTQKYNDILSQKRAESAVEYILSKGIPAERLTAKGYGERVPKTLTKDTAVFTAGTVLTHTMLDSLEKIDEKASELGHQLNRRTEFRIVGFIEEADSDTIEVIDNGEEEEILNENLLKNEEEIIENKFNKQD